MSLAPSSLTASRYLCSEQLDSVVLYKTFVQLEVFLYYVFGLDYLSLQQLCYYFPNLFIPTHLRELFMTSFPFVICVLLSPHI